MKYLWILFVAIAIIALLIFLTTYICYYIAFYAPRKKKKDPEEYPIPVGEIYEPFRDQMIAWIKETRALSGEEVSIQSYDGLTLKGKYYEYAKGAPIELMMHGYRGEAERDLGGGVQRCFALKRNALIVDQRACGASEGHQITFGIKERRDCLDWVNFMIKHFGPDVRIILTGISMGGSTVLMAAGEELPKNVIGVLSDCGFTSAKEIMLKVIRQMHLPAKPLYPFVKLAAKWFCKFDLEETSAIEAVQKCKVPAIFFHGETDDFVPCDMSRANYEACASTKKLVTIKGAGHGLSYIVDPETYLKELGDFLPS